ncbi:MAG: HD domain-containing protein [Candidatus Omnitrophica bacterium]|nr:HD domain-containing protein [Candidatus Omnitrophota bacterium]
MKHYNAVFSAFHTIYRLTTSSSSIRNFSIGVCKVYKSVLNADEVTMVCTHVDSYPFLRISLKDKHLSVKKGGVSILTQKEREMLNQERDATSKKTLVHAFVFSSTLGIIHIKRKPEKEVFTDIEKKYFRSLCESVSIGLKIFHQYKEENKTVINYIKSLTNLLGQYDTTSSLHVKSLSRLIKAVGKELRLTEIELRSLEYASLLHDAGKIQLPTDILTKQKRLTNEEFKLIMKHPRKGVELIKNLDFLKPAIPIILHHHERYDGKGYPSKLKKDQIPIGSKILAVLDAFDAMFFGRPYRKKKQLESIKKELKKEIGKQFDPKVIECFLKILDKKNIRRFLSASDK